MLDSPLVRTLIRLSIEEDLALGDVTSENCVAEDSFATADVIARESLVVCGLSLVPWIFLERDIPVEIEFLSEDGAQVEAGESLLRLRGASRDLLSTERIILNFLQRMSGVATVSRRYAGESGDLTVLDTRKTIPGWRVLDKYAVSVGGCRNHRFGLGDMILVKNNHVDAAKGASRGERMRAALSEISRRKPFFLPVEVEVRDQEELQVALEFSPTAVLLDNMSDDEILASVKLIKATRPQTVIEASGGMTRERIQSLQGLGVDAVSVGALTTRSPNVDISMRLEIEQ